MRSLLARIKKLEKRCPELDPWRVAMWAAADDAFRALEACRAGDMDDDEAWAWLTRWTMSLGGRPVPTIEEARAKEAEAKVLEAEHKKKCRRLDLLPMEETAMNAEEADMGNLRPLYETDGDGVRTATVPVNSSIWSVISELRAKHAEYRQERAALDALTYESYLRRMGGRPDSPALRQSYERHHTGLEQRVRGLAETIADLNVRLVAEGIDPDSIGDIGGKQ